MSKEMQIINRQIQTLQKELIRLLENGNIEYIDLYAFAGQIENLKLAKNNLYLNQRLNK